MTFLPSAWHTWLERSALATGIAGLMLAGLAVSASSLFPNPPTALTAGGIALMLAFGLGLCVTRWASYRFTLWILLCNLAALMAPQWFKSIGGLSLSDPWLLLIVVQLIMFGMGTQMSVSDFYHVLKMPTAVLVGVCSQFLIMPLVGFTLAMSLPLPKEIAAGLVLIGSCSSGLASNVMAYMARGNLALSVTLTAITTVLAPIVTPLWMQWLAGSLVQVDSLKMSLDIVKIVLVPILAAFVHDFLSSPQPLVRRAIWGLSAVSCVWLLWLSCGGWSQLSELFQASTGSRRAAALSLPGFVAAAFVGGMVYHGATLLTPAVVRWMPRLSMLGIIYFTLVATAEGRDQLMQVGWLLVLAVTVHNLAGFTIGYWGSRLLGLSGSDARTIAIEVGMQNGAMAVGLARGMDKLATTGLAAIIFAPLMNVSGSLLANYWRRHAEEDDDQRPLASAP